MQLFEDQVVAVQVMDYGWDIVDKLWLGSIVPEIIGEYPHEYSHDG